MDTERTPSLPLHLKYLLEFLVVFLGVTISFWLSEWNEGRKLEEKHRSDVMSLVEDLQRDERRLAIVDTATVLGLENTRKLCRIWEAYHNKEVDYAAYCDVLIAIQSPYSYPTFFMNNSTYKSLLGDGRIHEFPESVKKQIRDYYEYVSKRVNDNNHIVDQISLDYYNHYHPLVHFIQAETEPVSESKQRQLLMQPEIRKMYEEPTFYIQTHAVKVRINIHHQQLLDYQAQRDSLERAIRHYATSIQLPLEADHE